MNIYVFSYMMSDQREKIKALVSLHIEYWNSQEFEYYKGGPYSDRSGGLIIFSSANIKEAESVISNDPFVTGDVLDNFIIKEWMPE